MKDMGPTRVRKWFVFQNRGSITEKISSDHFELTSLLHPTPVKRPELQLADLVIGPELCVNSQFRIGTLCTYQFHLVAATIAEPYN